jgi:hypothetical protein
MFLMHSVHNHTVYGYAIACEEQRIVIHTELGNGRAQEFADVFFGGVVAHHFESVMLPGNVLFAINDVSPEMIVQEWADLFAGQKENDWPGIKYGEPGELVTILTLRGIRGYEVCGLRGMSGWVLAETMEIHPREQRAAV